MVSAETLRGHQLFARQSDYMLEELARLTSEVRLKPDEWLFQEEEPALHLYLITEGSISLCMNLFLNGRGQHIEATSPLGPREVIGWSAIVKPHIYKFGARAEQESTLIAFRAKSLRELLDDNPGFGYYFLKNIAEVIGERLNCKCVQLLSLVLDSKGEPIIYQTN